jgi:hypothetical protein
VGHLAIATRPDVKVESRRVPATFGLGNTGKLVTLGTVWVAQSAFLTVIGYYATFSYFGTYDDEGSWLIGLRGYHLHGSLYNHTYAQAGPFFYEAWSLVYSVFNLQINWDTGRLMTLIVWIATTVVMGIAIWIFSRRVLLGLVAQLVSFLVMFLLSGVSMEAAGIAHFMGACVLLGLALFVRGIRRVGMMIIGIACAAAVFSKVNVGVFALSGLVAAVMIFWPNSGWRTARKLVVAVGLAVLPVVLMEQALSQPRAWHYCVLELIYLVGLVVVFQKRVPDQSFSLREIWFGLGGALGATALIAVGVLINGTSFSQFVHGAILGQRGLTKVINIPLPITGPDVAIAIVSSVAALAVAAYTARRGSRPPWMSSFVSGYVRFALGVWILLAITEDVFPGWSPPGIVVAPGVTILGPGQSFLLAAPFVWVVAFGPHEDEEPRFSFARTAICVMAVLSCLEGFPVAGSQMLWASLPLVPVGILCITDGVSLLTRGAERAKQPQRTEPIVPLAAIGLSYLALLGTAGQTLSIWLNTYNTNKPVALPGAEKVRLPAAVVDDLREVTGFLKQNCTTFWSIPGYNSFYFLSGEEPVTGLNSTQAWWKALSREQQNENLIQLRKVPRLCLIEGRYAGVGTDGTLLLKQTRLIRFLEHEFVPVKTVGYYELLVRRAVPTATTRVS